jgi:hypothetical protein
MSNSDAGSKAGGESPMTFRAGGGGGGKKKGGPSKNSSSRNRNDHTEEKKDDAHPIVPHPPTDDRCGHRPPQTPSTMARHRERASSSSRSSPPPHGARRADVDSSSNGEGGRVGAPSLPPASYFPVVRAGLRQKRTPFEVKNWISCLLTLDGRDKFTKVRPKMCRSGERFAAMM